MVLPLSALTSLNLTTGPTYRNAMNCSLVVTSLEGWSVGITFGTFATDGPGDVLSLLSGPGPGGTPPARPLAQLFGTQGAGASFASGTGGRWQTVLVVSGVDPCVDPCAGCAGCGWGWVLVWGWVWTVWVVGAGGGAGCVGVWVCRCAGVRGWVCGCAGVGGCRL